VCAPEPTVAEGGGVLAAAAGWARDSAMGCCGCGESNADPRATELRRSRAVGDFTSAELKRFVVFFRTAVLARYQWTHEPSGRLHTATTLQPLQRDLRRLDLRCAAPNALVGCWGLVPGSSCGLCTGVERAGGRWW
jgi:hypothetical protein